MHLLVSVFAALIYTILWYKGAPDNKLKLNVLSWMFWGSSMMWLIDAWYGYMEDGADFFCPAPADMLNELYLGLSVVAVAMIIWLVVLFVKDPEGKIKAALTKKKK